MTAIVVKTIDTFFYKVYIWESYYEGLPYRAKFLWGKRFTEWYNPQGETVGEFTTYTTLAPNRLDKDVKEAGKDYKVKKAEYIEEFWAFDKVERKLENESDL